MQVTLFLRCHSDVSPEANCERGSCPLDIFLEGARQREETGDREKLESYFYDQVHEIGVDGGFLFRKGVEFVCSKDAYRPIRKGLLQIEL